MAKKAQNMPKTKQYATCPFPLCNEHSASGDVPAFNGGDGMSRVCPRHARFILDTQVAKWYIKFTRPKRFRLLRRILRVVFRKRG